MEKRVIILPSLGAQLTAPSALMFNSLNYAQNTDSRRNGTTVVADVGLPLSVPFVKIGKLCRLGQGGY